MDEFDLMVIGAGSGLDVANAAASRGQSVAVVERGPLGGTCLNRGCIPSKMLLYHAEVVETIERADEFHVDATVDDVDFEAIVEEVTEDVTDSSDSIERGVRESDAHDLVRGEARFVDERTVEIVAGEAEGRELRADAVVVAAGTRPAEPAIDGLDDVDSLTSTDALQLTTPPEHLVIVGGGYIAAELAHFFGTFGSQVSIVGRRERLLPQSDPEVTEWVTEQYADRFDVYAGYEATAVEADGDEVTVTAEPYEGADLDARPDGVAGDGDDAAITGDELLVAAGRTPNTDRLNVEAAGIETDDAGFVETDEFLRTSADGVWALGDVVGEYLLKHNANHEARTVARNLFGDDLEPVDYTAMPFAVFGSPEVAGVGATEDDLEGREYATRTYRYEDTGRGRAMKTEGVVKAIIDLEGEILGCHVAGPEASNLIEEVVVAMKRGSGTVQDIRESIHVHPALSEVIQRGFSGQFQQAGDHQHHH